MGILKKKDMVLFRYNKKNKKKSKDNKQHNEEEEEKEYKNIVKFEEDIDSILIYLKEYEEVKIIYENY